VTDNQTETGKVEILPGVQLTAEAQAILTKQLNRRIVWGYKATKFFLLAFSLAPLLVSALFTFVAVRSGIPSFRSIAVAFVLIGGPIAVSAWLFSRARRY
jgi:hypothetical protein